MPSCKAAWRGGLEQCAGAQQHARYSRLGKKQHFSSKQAKTVPKVYVCVLQVLQASIPLCNLFMHKVPGSWYFRFMGIISHELRPSVHSFLCRVASVTPPQLYKMFGRGSLFDMLGDDFTRDPFFQDPFRYMHSQAGFSDPAEQLSAWSSATIPQRRGREVESAAVHTPLGAIFGAALAYVRLLQVPIETSSSRSARRSTSQSGFSIEEVDGNVRTPHSESEPVVQEPEEGGYSKKTVDSPSLLPDTWHCCCTDKLCVTKTCVQVMHLEAGTAVAGCSSHQAL